MFSRSSYVGTTTTLRTTGKRSESDSAGSGPPTGPLTCRARVRSSPLMRSVPSLPLVGPFADRLLAIDLPALDDERRTQVVAFAARRVDGMPSVMRLGVVTIAVAVRAAMALTGGRVVGVLARRPLPLLGEYVRLVRSLGYTYVWETWPDSRPDGGRP